RLITTSIADQDPSIRQVVIESLEPKLDKYLVKADILQALFVALNDEIFHIREAAITVIGRLVSLNPALIMPSLRRTLVQLLTELKFSNDTLYLEQSSNLLGHLILGAHDVVKPYVEPILDVLVPRLKDPHSGVATSVLSTLGKLTVVGAEELQKYID